MVCRPGVNMGTRARPWRPLFAFMAGLLLVGVTAPVPATAVADGYEFEVVGCDAPQFADRLPADLEVECGLLTVPENRELPMVEGNIVVLPVAILKATGSDPAPDPIVMLNGGPGSAGLEYFLGGIFGGPPVAPDYVTELLKNRDVILYDQRGSGRAEPTTFCPNELPVMYEIFGAAADPVYEKQVLLGDMAVDCVEDLRASGVDLDQYDTPTLAKDLKDLRAALGLPKWNVYGHSYGGQLGLELMRVQRGGLRSVVLDAPVRPDVDQYSLAAWGPSAERGFNAIADTYGVDDIDTRLAGLRAKFDSDPYETADPYTGAPLVLTGKDAMHVLHSGMYLPDFIPGLGLFVANLEAYGTAGEFDLGVYLGFDAGQVPTTFDLYALFLAGSYSGVYDGMAWSIICADGARLMPDVDLAALDADVPIGVKPVPPGASRVNRTTVPTLVRQGLLDHVVPPQRSQDLVQRLGTRAQYLEFPTYGHPIQDYGGCSTQTLAQFVNNPDGPVDTSCITP
jgi:pimeloyl-ACP methyl ester carboxylesterase